MQNTCCVMVWSEKMLDLGPDVRPGALFSAYVPVSVGVEDARRQISERTGLGVHFYYRMGPREIKGPGQAGFPLEPLDSDISEAEFPDAYPDTETVVYVGRYKEPIAANA